MKVGPEQAVKRAICEWLSLNHSAHCFFWVHESVGIYDPTRKVWRKKNSKYQIRGVSDILGVWKGQMFAVEVKAPTSSRVSPEQKEFLANVRKHGGIAFVARSIEDVIKGLTEAGVYS